MTILAALLLIPLAAVGMMLLGNSCARRTALAAAWANVVVVLYLAIGFWCVPDMVGARYEMDWSMGRIPGLPEIHFHLGLDGISFALVALASIVTLAAVAVTPRDIARPRAFFICLLLVSLGAIGAFLSLDLFWLYVFHEIALIPTFLLVGIWGGPDRRRAAFTMTLYLGLASLVLLVGLLTIVLALPEPVRTFDLPSLVTALHATPLPVATQVLAAGLLLLGLGTLVALFPFHSWAPAGYAEAPAPAAMLHAGVLKKFGLYALLRLWPLVPAGAALWQPLLLWLLCGNLLAAGLITLAQKRFGYLLGYSSVMHMGYLFLGIAAWNVLGVAGVVLLMVGHGLSTALLFALRGMLQARLKTDELSQMGGLLGPMPVLGALLLIGSFAAIGLPGLANFAGEAPILFGAWQANLGAAVIVALAGVFLSAVYQLRALEKILFGPRAATSSVGNEAHDLPRGDRWPYLLLAGALVFVGVAPVLVSGAARPAVEWLLRGGAL